MLYNTIENMICKYIFILLTENDFYLLQYKAELCIKQMCKNGLLRQMIYHE